MVAGEVGMGEPVARVVDRPVRGLDDGCAEVVKAGGGREDGPAGYVRSVKF